MENPALSANRLPEQIAGEMIMLSRAGIEFTAKSGAHKFHAHGDLYVTTLRVVFVASRASGSFQAFDLPLATMRSEKFNQPIFGANNLSGTTPPLAGSTALAPSCTSSSGCSLRCASGWRRRRPRWSTSTTCSRTCRRRW